MHWKRIEKDLFFQMLAKHQMDGINVKSHVITIGEPPMEIFFNGDIDANQEKYWPERFHHTQFKDDAYLLKISRDWLGDDGKVDDRKFGKYWEYYCREEDEIRIICSDCPTSLCLDCGKCHETTCEAEQLCDEKES